MAFEPFKIGGIMAIAKQNCDCGRELLATEDVCPACASHADRKMKGGISHTGN